MRGVPRSSVQGGLFLLSGRPRKEARFLAGVRPGLRLRLPGAGWAGCRWPLCRGHTRPGPTRPQAGTPGGQALQGGWGDPSTCPALELRPQNQLQGEDLRQVSGWRGDGDRKQGALRVAGEEATRGSWEPGRAGGAQSVPHRALQEHLLLQEGTSDPELEQGDLDLAPGCWRTGVAWPRGSGSGSPRRPQW